MPPLDVPTSPARHLLRPVVARLGVRLFDVLYGERPIAEVPRELAASVPLVVRAPRVDDVAAIAARLGGAEGVRVAQAFGAGDMGVVATSGDEIAGFIWASLTQVALPGVPICALPRGGAYVHSAYVFPEHRGKRVLQTVARTLHLEVAARDCRFTCRLIDRANHASIAATDRGSPIRYRWAPVVVLPGRAAFFLLGRPGSLRRRSAPA